MNCNDIFKPKPQADECRGYEIKDQCVTITFDAPRLNIYKGDRLDEVLVKLITLIGKNE